MVARERGIRRPAELPLLDHIRAQSPFMKDSLTTELVIRHPSAFPFIPETEATINQKHEFGFTRNLPYDALKSLYVIDETCISRHPALLGSLSRKRLMFM